MVAKIDENNFHRSRCCELDSSISEGEDTKKVARMASTACVVPLCKCFPLQNHIYFLHFSAIIWFVSSAWNHNSDGIISWVMINFEELFPPRPVEFCVLCSKYSQYVRNKIKNTFIGYEIEKKAFRQIKGIS